MGTPIKIVIADDHEVMIDGIMALLTNEPTVQVVGRALDGQQLLQLVKHKPLDLVIMDIDMPHMNGAEATIELKQSHPALKILVLTMYHTPEFITELVKAGADGYILKSCSKRILVEAIQQVAKGEKYFPIEIKEKLFDGLVGRQGHTSTLPEVTEREKEIIRLICNEMTSHEIAEMLFLSFHTVEKHRKNIIAKLQVKNTAGLVKYAMRHGLAD